MTLVGIAVLSAGVVLGLLLVTGPALSAPILRRPNARGRRVTLLAGLFPAVTVVLVAVCRLVVQPDAMVTTAVLLAVTFGTGGLLSDVAGGRPAVRKGLEVRGVIVMTEVAVALVAAAGLATTPGGRLAAAADVVAVAALFRSPWPAGATSIAGAAAFVPLVLWAPRSPLVEASLPAAVAAAVLAPFERQGRLLGGRAVGGVLGALIGAVLAPRLPTAWRVAVAVAAGAGAAAPGALERARRRGEEHDDRLPA